MPDFVAMIQSALDQGGNTHSVDDVIEGVGRGDYQWWAGKNSVCVTEIVEFPQKKGFNFWLAGGDVVELMQEIEPVAAAFGKDNGCVFSYGSLVDRPGWDKVVPDGYEKGWRIFRKTL